MRDLYVEEVKRLLQVTDHTQDSITSLRRNIRHVGVPALVVLPCFITNEEEAIKAENAELLAQALAHMIQCTFPEGCTIGISIGHENDYGAAISCRGKLETVLSRNVVMALGKAIACKVTEVVVEPATKHCRLSEAIVNLSAEVDDAGELTVRRYTAWVGSKFVVAGMDSSRHRKPTALIQRLIRENNDSAAREVAYDYVAQRTMAAPKWLDIKEPTISQERYSDVEFLLRYLIHHNNETRVALFLQRLLGVKDDCVVGPITQGAIYSSLLEGADELVTRIEIGLHNSDILLGGVSIELLCNTARKMV
jgi:hypothetical protein